MTADAAIRRGVAFLVAGQLADGEFPSVAGVDAKLAGPVAPDSNYFTTPQVLWSLGFVADRRCARMIRRAAAFMAGAFGDGGRVRYFSNKIRRHIDPDTDTTACAAAALRARAPESLPAHDQVCAGLLQFRDSGGRFLTWMRANTVNDVDAVVNANVLWLLRDHPDGDGAASWLVELLQSKSEKQWYPYYESSLALYHAISRAAFCGASKLSAARELIIDRVKVGAASLDNPVELAFAVCTLCNLGLAADAAVRVLVDRLLDIQRDDGGWPATAVWNGPELPAPRSIWWGSEHWNTAMCLEALARTSG